MQHLFIQNYANFSINKFVIFKERDLNFRNFNNLLLLFILFYGYNRNEGS